MNAGGRDDLAGDLTADGGSDTGDYSVAWNVRELVAKWRHAVAHASRAYWIVQVTAALLTVFVTAQLLQLAAQLGGTQRDHALLSTVLDAALVLALTHLVLRPLLLVAFVGRRTSSTASAALALALLSCAIASVLANDVALALTRSSGHIQEIRFHTGSSDFGIMLSGWQLFAMQVVNALVAYSLWTALYLGWKAISTRRALQSRVNHARMWQLTRQMGPHFLFNTFNSIRGLIYEDRDRAAELVTRLSELLRSHLEAHDETHQPLVDECQVARNYLEIELVRLEPRLSYDFDIAADCERVMLPTLTVLTAVENAVKHGVAPNPGPGWIRIRARRNASALLLDISNSYGQPSSAESTGIGLKNLRERLLLSTGGRARVHSRRQGSTFELSMELPL